MRLITVHDRIDSAARGWALKEQAHGQHMEFAKSDAEVGGNVCVCFFNCVDGAAAGCLCLSSTIFHEIMKALMLLHVILSVEFVLQYSRLLLCTIVFFALFLRRAN